MGGAAKMEERPLFLGKEVEIYTLLSPPCSCYPASEPQNSGRYPEH